MSCEVSRSSSLWISSLTSKLCSLSTCLLYHFTSMAVRLD